jgi:hypothetical protein
MKENTLLLSHLSKVTQEKKALEAKYNNTRVIDDVLPIALQPQPQKRKRIRRTASEISREFSCCVEKCGKSYGTEASLLQHIKLKHSAIYGSKEQEEHLT